MNDQMKCGSAFPSEAGWGELTVSGVGTSTQPYRLYKALRIFSSRKPSVINISNTIATLANRKTIIDTKEYPNEFDVILPGSLLHSPSYIERTVDLSGCIYRDPDCH